MEEARGLVIEGVHQAWDGSQVLRTRMRDGEPFMHPQSGLSADNRVCTLNREILLPMLSAMGSFPDRRLPSIPCLRTEIQAFLECNKRLSPADAANIPGDAIHIRKLLSFVKAKARREEVSIDFWISLVCYSRFSVIHDPCMPPLRTQDFKRYVSSLTRPSRLYLTGYSFAFICYWLQRL